MFDFGLVSKDPITIDSTSSALLQPTAAFFDDHMLTMSLTYIQHIYPSHSANSLVVSALTEVAVKLIPPNGVASLTPRANTSLNSLGLPGAATAIFGWPSLGGALLLPRDLVKLPVFFYLVLGLLQGTFETFMPVAKSRGE